MYDPIGVPRSLHELSRPYAEALHLYTLPFHVHEVLLSFAFYLSVEKVVSPWLSTYFFPNHYPRFARRTKVNWDIHFTSFVQSIIICTAVLTVMRVDTHRIGDSWENRIWAYTGAAGCVQAMATGYFMWDLIVCTINIKVLGPLDLVHALAATPIAFLGFRPFALYYGIAYLLFELSTPFVNIHWFLDKIDMTGSRTQWYNGIILMVTFFSCRLLYGSYVSFLFCRDLWTAFNAEEIITTQVEFSATEKPISLDHSLPFWFGPIFVVINTILMLLNFYWFSKMAEAVRKRFRPGAKDPASRKPLSEQNPNPEMIATGESSHVRRRAK